MGVVDSDLEAAKPEVGVDEPKEGGASDAKNSSSSSNSLEEDFGDAAKDSALISATAAAESEVSGAEVVILNEVCLEEIEVSASSIFVDGTSAEAAFDAVVDAASTSASGSKMD